MSSTAFNLKEHPHRRYNPLTREWVLVSPHRTARPWQGQIEEASSETQPAYDPTCYLCPGNARAGGVKNPSYTGTFVFENDFAALRPDTPAGEVKEDDLLIARSEAGICRVVCFSPRHDLTISRMDVTDLKRVVETWAEQFLELGGMANINAVQIFENRGAMMGASNPHPHGQIWANESLPNELTKEVNSFEQYYAQHRVSLLSSYLALEQRHAERIICANDHFTALVPFWAVWPYEILLVSNREVTGMDELSEAEREGLAEILKRITTSYDNLFNVPFPYTMGFHQRPTDDNAHAGFHLHAHFYPPLLRSATVRKFMVGYEMLATPQRDITPEMAASRLREVGEKHYLE